MGRRGPPKTPTPILKIRGSHRAKSREKEPRIEGEVPPRPDWLLPLAAEEWERLAPELAKKRLLTAGDWVAFAGYCQQFAHWQAAEVFMVQHGTVHVMRDDKGNVKWSAPVPQFGIAQKALEKVMKIAAQFGLTPSSRGNLVGVGAAAPEVPTSKKRFFRA